jgi:2-methylcitrate dehydratase PrpD
VISGNHAVFSIHVQTLQPMNDPAASLAPYAIALSDWLACAVAGSDTRAARAARHAADGQDGQLIALGTAGHVLDFDDTFAPGLSHVSAPLAPVALLVGREVGATVAESIEAFAAGWEAAAAMAEANHPQLRDRGWHPTSVCGVVGAAIVAARLQKLTSEQEGTAVRLALLRAGGLSAAFGSDGKSLQVGFAAATGAGAARLAAAGARIAADLIDGRSGFPEAYGARVVLERDTRAVDQNWIKAYPCCLQTHSAIEAATLAREAEVSLEDGAVVLVHPVSLRTAALDEVSDGLQAKFSIPYLTAYSWSRGTPVVSSFAAVDGEVQRLARTIRVQTDDALAESEARLVVRGSEVARVEAALGSPSRPMTAAQVAEKATGLAGSRAARTLDDGDRPIAAVLEETGLA